jgi:hypothetical protein
MTRKGRHRTQPLRRLTSTSRTLLSSLPRQAARKAMMKKKRDRPRHSRKEGLRGEEEAVRREKIADKHPKMKSLKGSKEESEEIAA